jgi:phosphatidylglycerol:prolipoprotein diacylglycerol transferase
MLPVLFRIGPIEIPAYGFMLAIGILLGWFYVIRQFPDEKNKEVIGNLLIYSVFAGLLCSRLNYIIEHWDEVRSWEDFFAMLISRSGLTVYGGVIGGIVTAYIYSRKQNLPALRVLDAGAPGICIGYFFGRAGCQLAGDGDYGTPSNLPWAMAYPRGTVPVFEPVHPTPVYEMILYALIFLVLVQYKKRQPRPGKVFFLFLIFAGIERFAIEFIRLNPPVAFGLTEAQIVSLILVITGAIGFMKLPQRTRTQSGLRPQPKENHRVRETRS